MSSLSFCRRVIFALAVSAVLVNPWPASAEPRDPGSSGRHTRITGLPLEIMARLWDLAGRLVTKTGCSIDPHGGCTNGQTSPSESPAQVDTGCGIDPHGGCTSGS